MQLPLPKDKDLARFIRSLIREHGATTENTGSNHIKVMIPGCKVLFTSRTPSCRRTTANFQHEVARALKERSSV